MNRIFLTRFEFNHSQLFALAQREHRPLVHRRIMAIAHVAQGLLTQETIARKLHIDKARIRVWAEQYNEYGLEGLEGMESHDIPLHRNRSKWQDDY